VQCIKLGKEAEGLDFPPVPGEMGKKTLAIRVKTGLAGLDPPADHAGQ